MAADARPSTPRRAGRSRPRPRWPRGRLREPVGVHRQRLGDLAAAQDLDRDVACGWPGRRPCSAATSTAAPDSKRASRSSRFTRLRVRPEHLERHRHLLVRTAQLAHPHVDRVLAALEAGAVLRAGAGALALVAAAGGLAVAGAVPAADALAVLARPGSGLEGVQADRLGGELRSSALSSDSSLLLDDDQVADARGPCRAAAASPAARRCGRSCAGRASAACRAGAGRCRWPT